MNATLKARVKELEAMLDSRLEDLAHERDRNTALDNKCYRLESEKIELEKELLNSQRYAERQREDAERAIAKMKNDEPLSTRLKRAQSQIENLTEENHSLKDENYSKDRDLQFFIYEVERLQKSNNAKDAYIKRHNIPVNKKTASTMEPTLPFLSADNEEPTCEDDWTLMEHCDRLKVANKRIGDLEKMVHDRDQVILKIQSYLKEV